MQERKDQRKSDELRPIRIEKNYLKNAFGSALVEFGDTKVICAATLEDKPAPFLKNTGRGWITAEYSMLPASTQTRTARESSRGKIGGRTHEIQRLIGRSLRVVADLTAFGEKTIYVDCDVIQADGGTRTASITGGFIALVELFRKMKQDGLLNVIPIKDYVSAVSVGIVQNKILLDLDYEEDSRADVDMNFVMTDKGHFVEVQGTTEHHPFTRDELFKMMDVAEKGCRELFIHQSSIIGAIYQIAGK